MALHTKQDDLAVSVTKAKSSVLIFLPKLLFIPVSAHYLISFVGPIHILH